MVVVLLRNGKVDDPNDTSLWHDVLAKGLV